MKGKIKLNFIFPVVTAILSVVWMYKGLFEYGMWDAASTSPKDGLFPFIIAAVLLIASIFNIISSFKEKPVTFEKNALYLVAALALVYFFTEYIGLLPALFIFYVLWLKLYARVDWKTTIIATVALFAVVYFGFAVGLQIRFPQGLLFEMLLG